MTLRIQRRGATLIEVLVAVGIVSVLMGLLIPSVQAARATARRAQCQNNLRNIGVGMANYESTFRRYPAGQRAVGAYAGMSWGADLLPFVEQPALWDLTLQGYERGVGPFNAVHEAMGKAVVTYGCPADSRTAIPQFASTLGRLAGLQSYLGISGAAPGDEAGTLYYGSRVRPRDIRDGHSNTIMLGERPPSTDMNLGWWYAGVGIDGLGAADTHMSVRERATPYSSLLRDCNRVGGLRASQPGNQCDALNFWSYHAGGANFLFADGSVRLMNYGANAVMPMLATRHGGEPAEF